MRDYHFRLLIHSALLLLPLAMPAQTAPELPAPQVTVLFGQKIQYYDVGAGPTVVLLHGLGSSAKGDWGCLLYTSRVRVA